MRANPLISNAISIFGEGQPRWLHRTSWPPPHSRRGSSYTHKKRETRLRSSFIARTWGEWRSAGRPTTTLINQFIGSPSLLPHYLMCVLLFRFPLPLYPRVPSLWKPVQGDIPRAERTTTYSSTTSHHHRPAALNWMGNVFMDRIEYEFSRTSTRTLSRSRRGGEQ